LFIHQLKCIGLLPGFGNYEKTWYNHLGTGFCVNISFCLS
jgi:hypothetical protein